MATLFGSKVFGKHTGSWGLPEYGLTEAVGRVLGRGQTFQGGSNVVGRQPVNQSFRQPVLGVAAASPTARLILPNQPGGGQPSGGQPSGGQPSGGGDQGLPLESVPTFQEPQFNIQPALEALGQAEQATEAERQAGLSELEASRTGALGRIKSAGELQQQNLLGQEARETGRVEEAQAEQKRGFAEVSQQFLGRFGRTGFGQGILGSLSESSLRNISGLSRALTETRNNINFEKNRVIEENNRLNEEVEAGVTAAKEKLRADFMTTMAGISAKKGQLLSDRSSAIQSALESYRDLVSEINARNTAFKQDIYLRNQSAATAASRAEQRNIKDFIANVSSWVDTGLLSESEARGALGNAGVAPFTGTQIEPTAGVGQTEEEKKRTSGSTQNLLNQAGYNF